MTKDVYEAPELIEIGSFETVTQGGSAGGFLDASFQAGTPVEDLTFS